MSERKYSFYSFLNSAVDGGEWPASSPGRALAPGENFHNGNIYFTTQKVIRLLNIILYFAELFLNKIT
jgi:hypothetical protein